MLLDVKLRRFACIWPQCSRKTFAQPLPEVPRYGRRTSRLQNALERIGFALGGNAGARLSASLQVHVSASTLLRTLHRAEVGVNNGGVHPPRSAPPVLSTAI